jgi:hypothetical protein
MYMENWNPFSTSTKVHSCFSLEAKNECTWKIFTIKIVTHQRFFIVGAAFLPQIAEHTRAIPFLLCSVPKWMTCLCEEHNTICREVFAFGHWKNTCTNIECRLEQKRALTNFFFVFIFNMKSCRERKARNIVCWLYQHRILFLVFFQRRRKNNPN